MTARLLTVDEKETTTRSIPAAEAIAMRDYFISRGGDRSMQLTARGTAEVVVGHDLGGITILIIEP